MNHLFIVIPLSTLGFLTVLQPSSAQMPNKPFVVVVESVEVEAKKKIGGVESDWEVAPAVSKFGLPDLCVIVIRRDAALEKQTSEINGKLNERFQEYSKKYPKDVGKMADAMSRDAQCKSLNAQLEKVLAKYKRQTPVADDTLKATYRFETVRIDAGDKISVCVEDKDVVGFDLAGATEITLTPEMIKSGKLEIKFGQVVSLKLSFKKAM
jgi:hypothetical protein